MSLRWTLVLLFAGLSLAAFCLWYERRPREVGSVSLFPATLLLGVGVILVIAALAHLVTLLTGHAPPGRGPRF